MDIHRKKTYTQMEVCRGESVNIELCEKIIIHYPTAHTKKWCKENLMLDNPDYYKLERLGKWTERTPKTIQLYEINGSQLWLPFGVLKDVWKLYPHKEAYTSRIKPVEKTFYRSGISLYPYQKNAVEAILKQKNGIVVMPCGAGKTNTGLIAISAIGGRALWLTHTQDLLMQSRRRAESILDIGNGTFGTITAGKVDIGTHITFATVQTMCKLDLPAYRDMWDIVIVDEAQHCCGSPTRVTQFYKVLSSLSARYKIGLTATPKRADGLERSMFALLGDKIFEVSRDDISTTCPVKILQVETGWTPDYKKITQGDGIIVYSKLIDELVTNSNRLNLIADYINGLSDGVMVLANRISYLHDLQARYKGKSMCLSGIGNSKKEKAAREKALQELNNGKIRCVFATYQLAKEGLDVPNLKYVVFATPEKDSTTVIQSVGRVSRSAPNKEYGTVIDFVDDFRMYQKWASTRRGYYRKINAKIL